MGSAATAALLSAGRRNATESQGTSGAKFKPVQSLASSLFKAKVAYYAGGHSDVLTSCVLSSLAHQLSGAS